MVVLDLALDGFDALPVALELDRELVLGRRARFLEELFKIEPHGLLEGKQEIAWVAAVMKHVAFSNSQR